MNGIWMGIVSENLSVASILTRKQQKFMQVLVPMDSIGSVHQVKMLDEEKNRTGSLDNLFFLFESLEKRCNV